MRPRKKILLYCPNSVTRDVLAFQMDLWGYAVTCADLDGLRAELVAQEFRLVLLLPGFGMKSWKQFAVVAKQLEKIQSSRTFPIRIYDTMKTLPASVAPAIHRIPTDLPTAEYLRMTLARVMARKRGPRGPRSLDAAAGVRPIYHDEVQSQKALVA